MAEESGADGNNLIYVPGGISIRISLDNVRWCTPLPGYWWEKGDDISMYAVITEGAEQKTLRYRLGELPEKLRVLIKRKLWPEIMRAKLER